MMKQLSKNLLATLSGLALVLFPQLSFSEGEEKADAATGGAAGNAAAKTAIGGVSAGTMAAVSK